MSFDMTTYKRITGQLNLEGIDFDAFRAAPLGTYGGLGLAA